MSWPPSDEPPPVWQQQPSPWDPPPPWTQPPRTSGLAIAALVVSLLGALICQLVSIVGLILGIVALNEINGSHGRVTGRGMAIAGIVIGALGLAFFGVAFIVFGLGAGGFWS